MSYVLAQHFLIVVHRTRLHGTRTFSCTSLKFKEKTDKQKDELFKSQPMRERRKLGRRQEKGDVRRGKARCEARVGYVYKADQSGAKGAPGVLIVEQQGTEGEARPWR